MKQYLFISTLLISLLFLTNLTKCSVAPGTPVWQIAKQILEQITTKSMKKSFCCSGDSANGIDDNDANGDGIIILDIPGKYQLTNNITSQIKTTTDNICLNLNCFTITSTFGTSEMIKIDSLLKNIYICGGILINTGDPSEGGSGIFVDENCSNIQINNVQITGCGIGINLNGANTAETKECFITNCELIENRKGILMTETENSFVQNCHAISCVTSGFELVSSTYNKIISCNATNIANTEDNESSHGFIATDGQGNIFQQCTTKNIQNDGSSGGLASGFTLAGTETDSKIINCLVNTVTSNPSNTYGFGYLLLGGLVSGIPDATGSIIDCFLMENTACNCDYGFAGYFDESMPVKNIGYNNGTNFQTTRIANVHTYDLSNYPPANDAFVMDNISLAD